MLRFLYFLFFPKLIVIFCLSDVRLVLFGCYRKEQTRGCREGKQFLNWEIRGAVLLEPSILVKMIPRILHSTVKVSTPQCIYKTGYCIDILILSNSWRFWFFALYCIHLIWCLIVAMGAATGPSFFLPLGNISIEAVARCHTGRPGASCGGCPHPPPPWRGGGDNVQQWIIYSQIHWQV